MIDGELTFKRFGYTLGELSKGSGKLVIAICRICSKPRAVKRYAYRDNCGRCAKLIRIKELTAASVASRIGSHHSALTKKKMSIAVTGANNHNYGKKASVETKKKQSASHAGEKNHFYGKKHTEEFKKRMSEIRKANPTHLGIPAAHGKGQYYCKNGKRIWMRSSWEIKLAAYFDDNNINWAYENDKFPINYEYKNEHKLGTYISDFKVWQNNPNEYEIWEVKGYWRDDAQIKYNAFREQYPKIVCKLLTRKELKELGLKGIR